MRASFGANNNDHFAIAFFMTKETFSSDSLKWSENVILVDADYLDRVAFDLIVNFERMINRHIPKGNLCHWLNCIALDGGLRPGDNSIQALFIHSNGKSSFDNLQPSSFENELDGKAFKDNLGEFTLHSFQADEGVPMEDLFDMAFAEISKSKEVKRVMVIGDTENYADHIKTIAAQSVVRDITLFSMSPLTGRGFYQEILGYSLMSALGIRSEEIPS